MIESNRIPGLIMRRYSSMVLTLLITTPSILFSQTLRGVVTEQGSGTPITGVAIELHGDTLTPVVAASTGPSGAFHIRAPAAGTYTLRMMHPSYEAWSTTLSIAANQDLLADVELQRKAIPIDSVVVTSRGRAYLGGFHERMRAGLPGHFLTPSYLESRKGAARTSDLLRGLSGVRVLAGRGFSSNVIVMRGGTTGCLPAVFVDGVPARQMSGSGVDDFITPSLLEAVEVYPSLSVTPMQFQMPHACGALVFWTRTGKEDGTPFTWKRVGIAAAFTGAVFLILNFVK